MVLQPKSGILVNKHHHQQSALIVRHYDQNDY